MITIWPLVSFTINPAYNPSCLLQVPNSRVEFAKEEDSAREEAGPRRMVQPRRRLGERIGLSGR